MVFKVHFRIVSIHISYLNTEVSSILVISVIILVQKRENFRDIFSLYMMVSSILVISVFMRQHERTV